MDKTGWYEISCLSATKRHWLWEIAFEILYSAPYGNLSQKFPSVLFTGEGQDGTSCLIRCHHTKTLPQEIAVETLYSAQHTEPQSKCPFSLFTEGGWTGQDRIGQDRKGHLGSDGFFVCRRATECSSPTGHCRNGTAGNVACFVALAYSCDSFRSTCSAAVWDGVNQTNSIFHTCKVMLLTQEVFALLISCPLDSHMWQILMFQMEDESHTFQDWVPSACLNDLKAFALCIIQQQLLFRQHTFPARKTHQSPCGCWGRNENFGSSETISFLFSWASLLRVLSTAWTIPVWFAPEEANFPPRAHYLNNLSQVLDKSFTN